MENRELKDPVSGHYFSPIIGDEEERGIRDMLPLAPFVVSGGRNTERYYFVHVNNFSRQYKFNIRPEYFGNESAFTEVFPSRIKEILSKNADAKVFCLLDMDTVLRDGLQEKLDSFVTSFQKEIRKGQVVLCDSMPSFEFWLLLHFTDYEGLLKNYPEVAQVLAPYIKPYFEKPDKRLMKLLKSEKYLQESIWVRRLLEEGRLELAIERAKRCLAREATQKGRHSYSNVFKAFE